MKYLLSFFLLGVILANASLFSSVAILLICYIYIFLILRKENPLNPLFWVFLAWGVLFTNTFSGIIKYNYIGGLLPQTTLVFSSFILIFMVGFYLSKKKTVRYYDNLNLFIEKWKSSPPLKIEKIFAWMSVIALLFSLIEVVFIWGFDISNPLVLREEWNNKTSATIFGQLGAILFSGGLFSITSYFINSKNKKLFLLAIVCFAVGSVLSAGRQQVFQIILLALLWGGLTLNLKLRDLLTFKNKIIIISLATIFIGYFIFIAENRNRSETDQRSMMEIFASVNSFSYDADFLTFSNKLPSALNGVIADVSFYFSHELVSFSEVWYYEDFEAVDFDFFMLFPFIERQFEKVFPVDETQFERMQKNANKSFIGFIGSTTWKTANLTLLKTFGWIGTYIFILLHGFFSRKLFERVMVRPSFATLNLSIANSITLFYTILYPLTGETPFFFYIVISIFLLFSEKKRTVK